MSDKRKLLLGRFKRRHLVVPLPEVAPGFSIRLRNLNELERSEYEIEQMSRNAVDREARLMEARRRLIILTAVEDESDEPLLTETDLHALGEIDSAITAKLYDHALTHCGLRRSDIEDLVGNSKRIRGGASPCASPSPSDDGTSTTS